MMRDERNWNKKKNKPKKTTQNVDKFLVACANDKIEFNSLKIFHETFPYHLYHVVSTWLCLMHANPVDINSVSYSLAQYQRNGRRLSMSILTLNGIE